jgi:L,D-peptidoglycan transpeptidase YkuD (ErfK/YbiS/YcfS/YnhG family)
MRVKQSRPIVVRRAPGRPCQARVQLANSVRRAALGRGSVQALKREGDGGTPLGRHPVRCVLYRADRLARPRTPLPVRAIRKSDAWCEDPSDRNYNRRVTLSAGSGHDRLMREDHLYDLIVVLGYNDRPRIRGHGSAVFVHLARPGHAPTAGCIAFSRRDLDAVLAEMRRGTTFVVMR